MRNSKLIETLETLSSSELKRFLEFVKSPFFNKNEKLIILTEHIIQSAPEFNEDDLKKESIYNKLFPKAAFDIKKFNLQLFFLNKLLEQYIAILEFQEDKILSQRFFIQGLQIRNSYHSIENEIKSIRKTIQTEHLIDTEFYYHCYCIEREYDTFLKNSELGKDEENKNQELFHLDVYYLATRLRESCETMVINFFTQKKFNVSILHSIVDYITKNLEQYSEIPIVYIYYQIILLFNEPNKIKFNDLLKYIEIQEAKFSPQELYKIYRNLIAYCHLNERYFSDKKYFSEMGISIYKRLINKGIIFNGSKKDNVDFINIVLFSLRLKDYQFTENFIKEYKDKLNEIDREFYHKRALASLHRTKNEIDKSIKILETLEAPNLHLQIDIKQTLLASYYLNNRLVDFEKLADSFAIFIYRKRNELPTDYYSLVHNYIQLLKQIFFLKLKYNAYTQKEYAVLHEKLLHKINETQPLLHPSWLLKEMQKIAPRV